MPVVVLERPQTRIGMPTSGGGFQGHCAQRREIATFSPWCTQGYPYSGSERYFQIEPHSGSGRGREAPFWAITSPTSADEQQRERGGPAILLIGSA